MRRKRLIGALLAGVALVASLVLVPVANTAAYTNSVATGIAELNLDTELGLASQAIIVVEPSSGRVLYAKNADAELPVASLTKMMTILVALDHLELDSEATITTEMLAGLDEFAVLGLSAGQTLSVRDLLCATLLPSAADAAQALALTVSGSIVEFAGLMNAKASELGLEHTQFSNPVGMDADAAGTANTSTARDMARLVRAGLDNETFTEIFTADEYYIAPLSRTIYKTVNRTAAASSANLDVSRLVGAKTGFTYAAGRCLASTGTVDDATQLIVVTLGAPVDTLDYIADSVKLYDYFAENFAWQTVLPAGTVVTNLPVVNSPTSSLELALDNAVQLYVPRDFVASDLTLSFEGVNEVASGTTPGSELGTLAVYFGDALVYSEPETLQVELFYYNWPLYISLAAVALIALFFVLRRQWQNHHHVSRHRNRRPIK